MQLRRAHDWYNTMEVQPSFPPTIFEVLAAYNKYGWPTPLRYMIVLSTAAPGSFQSMSRMQHNVHIWIFLTMPE